MKVKFLSNCRAEGVGYAIGDEADLSEAVGRDLIAIGRVEAAGLGLEDVAAFSTSDPDPEPEPKPEPKFDPKPAPRRAAQKPTAPKED
jgi:hypothetical protein